MTPVSIRNLIRATQGSVENASRPYPRFARVSIDSRTLQPSDLFWAIQGEKHDGHSFVEEAAGKGAGGFVVNEKCDASMPLNRPVLRVKDTLTALQEFAGWYRRRHDPLTIGVTGSVGKTTTRELIHRVLGVRYSGMQTTGNLNNHIGVPLSLLNIEKRHLFAVLELGASRIGEIRQLATMSRPDIGVVTRIVPSHLETFGSLGGIEQGKGELVESLNSLGLAILNGDDERVARMASRTGAKTITIGLNSHNEFQATEVQFDGERLHFKVEQQTYSLPAHGKHLITSALAAIAIARELSLTAGQIQEGFDTFELLAGRGRVEQIGPWAVIDETYNANPGSMQAACETILELLRTGKKILIAGEMADLGDSAPAEHLRLGTQVARSGVDRFIIHGPHSLQAADGALNAGMLRNHLAPCSEFDDVIDTLDQWLEPGDIILVKGSRSMQMERVIDWLKTKNDLPSHPPHIHS